MACLKQAKEFTQDKQAIQKKIDKLQAKIGTGSLFEEEVMEDSYLEELPEESTESINNNEEEEE